MSINRDLTRDHHRERNALEDYAFLTDAGTPHAEAIERVGHDEESWKRLQDTITSRNNRAIRKEKAK